MTTPVNNWLMREMHSIMDNARWLGEKRDKLQERANVLLSMQPTLMQHMPAEIKARDWIGYDSVKDKTNHWMLGHDWSPSIYVYLDKDTSFKVIEPLFAALQDMGWTVEEDNGYSQQIRMWQLKQIATDNSTKQWTVRVSAPSDSNVCVLVETGSKMIEQKTYELRCVEPTIGVVAAEVSEPGLPSSI
jgi:hypothetical protein